MAALSFYNFIPERVDEMTSTCMTKNKLFTTPVGVFSYTYLNRAKFSCSIQSQEVSPRRSFLIASPEKTFVEIIVKNKEIRDRQGILEWLDSMRIDVEGLKKLRITELRGIQKVFNKKQVDLFIDVVKELKQNA